MSAWGGPRTKVYGVFGASMIIGIGLMIAGLRPSLTAVALGAFVAFFAIPIGNGSSQAIWQRKVEPDIQGRVFALRRTISQAATPIALLLVGPLVDRVLEPLMADDGALADSLGSVIGTGSGRGAALMMLIMGLLAIGATAIAYSYQPLRNLERDVPDAIPDETMDAVQPIPDGAGAQDATSDPLAYRGDVLPDVG